MAQKPRTAKAAPPSHVFCDQITLTQGTGSIGSHGNASTTQAVPFRAEESCGRHRGGRVVGSARKGTAGARTQTPILQEHVAPKHMKGRSCANMADGHSAVDLAIETDCLHRGTRKTTVTLRVLTQKGVLQQPVQCTERLLLHVALLTGCTAETKSKARQLRPVGVLEEVNRKIHEPRMQKGIMQMLCSRHAVKVLQNRSKPTKSAAQMNKAGRHEAEKVNVHRSYRCSLRRECQQQFRPRS